MSDAGSPLSSKLSSQSSHSSDDLSAADDDAGPSTTLSVGKRKRPISDGGSSAGDIQTNKRTRPRPGAQGAMVGARRASRRSNSSEGSSKAANESEFGNGPSEEGSTAAGGLSDDGSFASSSRATRSRRTSGATLQTPRGTPMVKPKRPLKGRALTLAAARLAREAAAEEARKEEEAAASFDFSALDRTEEARLSAEVEEEDEDGGGAAAGELQVRESTPIVLGSRRDSKLTAGDGTSTLMDHSDGEEGEDKSRGAVEQVLMSDVGTAAQGLREALLEADTLAAVDSPVPVLTNPPSPTTLSAPLSPSDQPQGFAFESGQDGLAGGKGKGRASESIETSPAQTPATESNAALTAPKPPRNRKAMEARAARRQRDIERAGQLDAELRDLEILRQSIVNEESPYMLEIMDELSDRREDALKMLEDRHSSAMESLGKVREADEEGIWTWWQDARDNMAREECYKTCNKMSELSRDYQKLLIAHLPHQERTGHIPIHLGGGDRHAPNPRYFTTPLYPGNEPLQKKLQKSVPQVDSSVRWATESDIEDDMTKLGLGKAAKEKRARREADRARREADRARREMERQHEAQRNPQHQHQQQEQHHRRLAEENSKTSSHSNRVHQGYPPGPPPPPPLPRVKNEKAGQLFPTFFGYGQEFQHPPGAPMPLLPPQHQHLYQQRMPGGLAGGPPPDGPRSGVTPAGTYIGPPPPNFVGHDLSFRPPPSSMPSSSSILMQLGNAPPPRNAPPPPGPPPSSSNQAPPQRLQSHHHHVGMVPHHHHTRPHYHQHPVHLPNMQGHPSGAAPPPSGPSLAALLDGGPPRAGSPVAAAPLNALPPSQPVSN